MVKLTVLNVKKKTKVDHREGMTARDVLVAKGVTWPPDGTVTVDGEKATPKTVVKADSLVVVTPNPSHGR